MFEAILIRRDQVACAVFASLPISHPSILPLYRACPFCFLHDIRRSVPDPLVAKGFLRGQACGSPLGTLFIIESQARDQFMPLIIPLVFSPNFLPKSGPKLFFLERSLLGCDNVVDPHTIMLVS